MPLLRLILLFTLLPAVELYLLLLVGARVGPLATLALILFTGALGAALARGQGLRVLGEIQAELEAGRLPAAPLVDGVLVLIAAAVLLTPGILTDAFGFLCLVPAVRTEIRGVLLRRFERRLRRQPQPGEVTLEPAGSWREDRPMKDVTPPRPRREP